VLRATGKAGSPSAVAFRRQPCVAASGGASGRRTHNAC